MVLIINYYYYPESNQYPIERPDYLNYELSMDPLFFERITFLPSLWIGLTVIYSIVWLVRRTHMRNLFLVGKEIEQNAKAATLRDKILWGIVITFIVGILSSIVVIFFMPGR